MSFSCVNSSIQTPFVLVRTHLVISNRNSTQSEEKWEFFDSHNYEVNFRIAFVLGLNAITAGDLSPSVT
jgi:hypothetical protein